MKRRSILELATMAAAAGSAGCARLLPRRQQYRLWFVHIHNGSTREQHVDIRIIGDGEVIFEHSYKDIPSFQDDQNDESSFAAMKSARLIENEWKAKRGTYNIKYRLSEQDSFEHVDISEVSDFEANNIGVSMQLLGGGMNQPTVGFKILEFNSEQQATQFVSTVTNQSDG